MKRREFIAALGGAAAWPFAANSQTRLPVIGFLGLGSARNAERLLAPFRLGLGDTGYAEGRNVVLEQRWADGQYQRIPMFAGEFVSKPVSVIVAAGGTQSALAAKAATKTIPVVFQVAADPVAAGLVAKLERPGANLTGVSNLASELGPKRLELLREALPAAKRIALLGNPTNRAVTPGAVTALQQALNATDIELNVVHAASEGEFDAAFSRMKELKAEGLIIVPDLMFVDNIENLAALAASNGLPSIFQFREFAAAGALMSYGGNIGDAMRQVGVYTGRILAGSKPDELPVQQFTRIELVVNLKAAKSLGLTVPPTLLARADEVIE